MLYHGETAASVCPFLLALTPQFGGGKPCFPAAPRSNPALHPRSNPAAHFGPARPARLAWPTRSNHSKARGSSVETTSFAPFGPAKIFHSHAQTPLGIERCGRGVRPRLARGSSVDFHSALNAVLNAFLIRVQEHPRPNPAHPRSNPALPRWNPAFSSPRTLYSPSPGGSPDDR